MTDLSCSWRGHYQSSAGSEASSEIQLLPQDREVLQRPSIPIPEQNELHANISGHPNDPVADCSSRCSDNQMSRKWTVDNANQKLAWSGTLDSDEKDKMTKDPAAYNDCDDDGEIHHLDIWHCTKVRSSGLVELQKASRFRAACIRLADLSLIKFDNQTVSMHPLVHEWARTRLGETVRQDAWEQALSVLALCSVKTGTNLAVRLVAHIKTCFRLSGEDINQSRLSLHVVRALYQMAWVHYGHRDPVASLVIFEILASSYELQPHTLASKSQLLLRAQAMCFGEMGEIDKMRSCVNQVVQSTTQWFEWNSWEAFDAQRLLADSYHTAGDSQAAANLLEPLYERYSQSKVVSDLMLRSLLQSLIWAHQRLSNNERAVTLFNEELQITRRLCSPGHPYLLNSLTRLSASYITVGAAEKAVALLRDIVDPKSKQIPRDYWWTEMMLTLARAYGKLDAYNQAIPVLEQINAHYSTPLSAKDPLRTSAIDQLAEAYVRVDRPSQAIELLENVVEMHSSSDSGRLISMDRLAKAYLDLNKPSQAVVLLEEVVEIYRSTPSPNDRNQLICMDRLAHAYLRLGKLNQAVELLKEVLEIHASSLVPENPVRLISMDRLARAYLELNESNQAVPLLEEVVKYLPANDPRRLISMDRLAEAHLRLRMPHRAVPLLQEVVKYLSANDPRRLISTDRLAIAYLELDMPEQAVPILQNLVVLRKNHLETLHADLAHLRWTRELLTKAQEKLRSTIQRHSLMVPREENDISDATADETSSNMVYQHARTILKRHKAPTDLDLIEDRNKSDRDKKRPRPT